MAYHHGASDDLITSIVHLLHSKSSGGSWNQQIEAFNEVDSFEPMDLKSFEEAKDIRRPMRALVVLGPRPLSGQPKRHANSNVERKRKERP